MGFYYAGFVSGLIVAAFTFMWGRYHGYCEGWRDARANIDSEDRKGGE